MKFPFLVAVLYVSWFVFPHYALSQQPALVDAIRVKELIAAYEKSKTTARNIELAFPIIREYNELLKAYKKDSIDLQDITNPELFGRKSAALAALKDKIDTERSSIEINAGLYALLLEAMAAEETMQVSSTEIIALLQQYNVSPSVINAHPFFRDPSIGLSAIAQSNANGIFTGANAAGNGSNLFSNAASLDVTNFALGLTDLLIERTKTELNTAFFKRFQEELNKPRYKDLGLLFPETVELLGVIGVEIYQFDHYLNGLRNAFDKDLAALLDHLPAVVERHGDDPVFKANPALEPSLQLALELAGWVKDGEHPGSMLLQLAKSGHADALAAADSTVSRELVSGIRLAALVSESLRRSGDSLHYWVGEEQLERLKDPVTLKIYLGLLYEMSKTAPFDSIVFRNGGGRITLTMALDTLGRRNAVDSLTAYRAFILKIGKSAQATMRAVDEFRALRKAAEADTSLSKKVRLERILESSFGVFEQFTALTKLAFEVEKLPYIRVRIPERAKRIVSNAERGGEVALLTLQKQYAGAVAKLTALLEEVLDGPEMEGIYALEAAAADPGNAALKGVITKKKTLYMEAHELQEQLDALKDQPGFRGKRKQIRGLKGQIKMAENRANLIRVPTGASLNTAMIDTLKNRIDTLKKHSIGTTGKEKIFIEKQIKALEKQKNGVTKDTMFGRFASTNRQILKKFLKYGTFMANVVEADNPEAVKKAIEVIALPPGSYTIKRESRFSVALNGYLGGFAGMEYIDGVSNKGLNNLGITMPVGVSCSWGNIKPDQKNPWSIGFFVPLIDLGAVASYRFGGDTTAAGLPETESVPTIQLKHLIAPGFFVEAGIPCTPLSFGLGVQLGPRLRTVNPKGSMNDIGDLYVRFGATLKVDIPLLHFYASPAHR